MEQVVQQNAALVEAAAAASEAMDEQPRWLAELMRCVKIDAAARPAVDGRQRTRAGAAAGVR